MKKQNQMKKDFSHFDFSCYESPETLKFRKFLKSSKRNFGAYFFLFVERRLPTDVQAEAIPLILGGGDVLMAAETGSGKTGAFCLPVLQVKLFF